MLSAQWVGRLCWERPCKQLLSRWWLKARCKCPCSRQEVFPRCRTGTNSYCWALCLTLNLPPLSESNGSSLRGCYWTKGPRLNPAEGGKDPPAQKALTICLSAGKEASMHSSSLVCAGHAYPFVSWGSCLPVQKSGWVPADQVMPVPWCHTSRRFALEQQQELPGSPSDCLEESSLASRFCR